MNQYMVSNVLDKFNTAVKNSWVEYDSHKENVKRLKEMGIDYKKVFGDLTVCFDRFKDKVNKESFTSIEDFILKTSTFLNQVKACYQKAMYLNRDNLYKIGIETANFEQSDIRFIEKFINDFLIIDSDTLSWWLFEDDNSSLDGENIKIIYIAEEPEKEREYDVLDAKDFLDLYYLKDVIKN